MKAMIRADERGTGLISVMVAMVILLVALSMITSTFFGASKLTRRAANFTAAGNFAEGVMERVTSQPFDRVITTKVTDGLPRLSGADCAVGVRDTGEGLKEITVTCSWSEGDQRRKTALSTLMARGDRR
jgi:type II secretory pathway pseudopilin PulG